MEEKYPRVGTAVFIRNKNGKYLFSKRLKGTHKGYLSIPGGKLEFNENIKDGMIRETLEETGIDISKYNIQILPVLTKNITEKNHYICVWALVELPEKDDSSVKYIELDIAGKPKNSIWRFYKAKDIYKFDKIFNKTKKILKYIEGNKKEFKIYE